MLAQCKAAVDAAVAARISHVVHVGVSAPHDTTIVHFGWHRLVETYIEQSGLGYTHLAPAAFMQNLTLSIDAASAPGILTHFVGDARPNWIDVDDIAAVAASVLRNPSAHHRRTYHLAAQAASLAEIAALLEATTGQSWRYQPAEPQVFFEAMTSAGADPVYMACVRTVFERTSNGTLTEPDDIFGVVHDVLGRPATSLSTHVARHRDAYTYPQPLDARHEKTS